MRVRGIDRFRGLAVALMVFFTLVGLLGGDLPQPLVHNAPGAIHAGDFVLPMFLFASGMSLAHFSRKRTGAGAASLAMDAVQRAARLAIAWIFLSPFSSGEFLGMDELSLSAALSLIVIAFAQLPAAWLTALALVPPSAYLLLLRLYALPDFLPHYLGGFAALPFYLPVMLAGAVAAKDADGAYKVGVAAALLAVPLLMSVPPYKSDASPSFMAISVAFSALVFILAGRFESAWAEYLGRRPFRLWILMFVVAVIPLKLIALSGGAELPIGLPWQAAALAGAATVVLLTAASMALDGPLKETEPAVD